MKFTPEVVAALKVLRAAAETDFERHRLDVLERDLHEPPTVEILDAMYQKFDGITYKKDSSGHYRKNFSIQQSVWRYYNGDIPEGYDIHHIDENKDENNITNFQLLTRAEHSKTHRENFQMPPRKAETFQCEICGRYFESVSCGRNRYCSVHCRNIAVKNAEHYKETRTCVVCGKPFSISKFSDTTCCSYSCAQKLGWAHRKENQPPKKRVCAYCGKEFETYSARAKYCSRLCKNRACRNKANQ
ncbi:MAG: HNH endonuclease [Selenomonadaceae bacterium]|nr:HNH endonuclease [Selenomonadaceae bacterium]